MPVNVYMLDIDRGSEGLKRIVVKAVQRSHQLEILRNALRDGLRECMILHCQRDITAQHFQSVEFTVFVQRIAETAAKRNYASQASSGFQRRETLEEFGSDVAVG